MLRKQLYIPEELQRQIKLLVLKEKKTEAEVVRELLASALDRKKRVKGRSFRNPADFLLSIALYKVKGPRDLSSRLDDYLYGRKSRKFSHLYEKGT